MGQEESYGSNDMTHNHYLEEARKKSEERDRNSKPSVMHTTSQQNTTNGSKQKPWSNNQTSRSFPVSKSSGVTSLQDIDCDILCQLLEEYFQPPSSVVSLMLPTDAQLSADTTGTPSSTTFVQDVPSISTSPTTQEIQSLVIHQDLSSEEFASNLHQLNQSFDNLSKWSKDHQLKDVIGNPARPISKRS
ncbi:hypothetical protein Tco_1126137 [Tanacetum coccineum]